MTTSQWFLLMLCRCLLKFWLIWPWKNRLESYPSEDLPEITNWSVEEICTGLRICLQATYLKFRNKFFRQIHGTAMGSPVSVVVTNLVMEYVEKRAIHSFGQQPRVWKRFVDDAFVILDEIAVDKFFLI